MPTRFRSSFAALRGGSGPGRRTTPSTSIAPPSNGSSAATDRSTVVLPPPESPISATISPRWTRIVTPRRTSRVPRFRRSASTLRIGPFVLIGLQGRRQRAEGRGALPRDTHFCLLPSAFCLFSLRRRFPSRLETSREPPQRQRHRQIERG